MKLGSHVSMSGKEMFLGSAKEPLSYGANTFMVYTGAPQNTKRKEISELNEMSILIFRGMLETMRIDKNKPTLAQAVHRTVQYLENTLRVYHLV